LANPTLANSILADAIWAYLIWEDSFLRFHGPRVIAKLRVVQREFHEPGEADRAGRSDFC
jgi:hypothetical protein